LARRSPEHVGGAKAAACPALGHELGPNGAKSKGLLSLKNAFADFSLEPFSANTLPDVRAISKLLPILALG